MVEDNKDYIQEIENKRTNLFQNFCFQYNAIITLIMGLRVEDALKAEVQRQFRNAFLWSKEAFILADFNDNQLDVNIKDQVDNKPQEKIDEKQKEVAEDAA